MTTITQLITRTLELDEAATQEEVRIRYSDFDARLFAEYRTAAPLLAKECQRLQDLHLPRDTRKGEWPVIDEYVHMWSGYEWMSRLGCDVQSPYYFWLPAPPSPEDT